MAMPRTTCSGRGGRNILPGDGLRRSARVWRDRLHRTLFDVPLPDALVIHDHQGWFVEVNARACESLGYTRDELLAMNVSDVERNCYLPEAQAAWLALEEGAQQVFHGRHRRKDGSEFPVKVRFSHIKVGGMRFYVGVATDTSLQETEVAPLQPAAARQAGAGHATPAAQQDEVDLRMEVDSILRGLAGLIESGPRHSQAELEWARAGVARLSLLAGPLYGKLFLDIAETLQAGLEAWLGPRDWTFSKLDISAVRANLAVGIQELAALLLGPSRHA